MRQRVILLSFIVMGAFLVFTVTLSRTYEVRKEALVREWAQEGDASLAAGKPSVALEDYRNALAYDSENGPIQLHLAESLLAANRLQEAHTYFLNLWERTPGSGILNLELARTSAKMGASDQAILYYRTAILGGWDQQPEMQRRDVRFELCEYLIAHGRMGDAEGEISGLSADIPDNDAQSHDRVGHLFQQAGEMARALAEYELALKSNPTDATIEDDAGLAAFQLSQYAKAEKYLVRAQRGNPSEELRVRLETLRQIQDGDPFLPELSDRDRAERIRAAYQQATTRLSSCQSASAGQSADQTSELASLSKEVSSLNLKPETLQRDATFQHHVMQLVFQIEDATAHACGDPTGLDEALTLIGKEHPGTTGNEQ